ncbi:MAG: type II toxin-antitoxin system RelE/ParE family toxin [Defluviitaleaceae bacterium]|nr:type II toxin-antitoxin system RelE/ParE family toxin [Defluviitaleaceae bacterium]MCL2275000.1 type II toxin-antitoxin system RelE/ParE family toxin [Defluviitaleaceae bacterium]
METYNVHFLQEALDDVEEIILYIAQGSRQAALSMHDKIIEKANDLSTFPKRGRLVPDKKMAEAGYRMLGIKPYIAFYRVIERTVFIYRVLHGATNYPLLYEKMV